MARGGDLLTPEAQQPSFLLDYGTGSTPPWERTPEPEPEVTNTAEPEPEETNTPEPEPEETNTVEPEPQETGTSLPEPEETNTPEPEPEETNTIEPEPEVTRTNPGGQVPQAPIDVPPVSRDVPPVTERPTPAVPDVPDPKDAVCRDVSESYEQIKELNRSVLRTVQNDLKGVYGSASNYLKQIYDIAELRNMPNVRKSFTSIGQFALRYSMPARLSDQDRKEFADWKRSLLQALGYIFRASGCDS